MNNDLHEYDDWKHNRASALEDNPSIHCFAEPQRHVSDAAFARCRIARVLIENAYQHSAWRFLELKRNRGRCGQ